jgi:hypothetical protein
LQLHVAIPVYTARIATRSSIILLPLVIVEIRIIWQDALAY